MMTSESRFPAHAGRWRAPGLNGSRRRRWRCHRPWWQFAAAIPTHARLRSNELGTERTLARFAFPQGLALEHFLIRLDDQGGDDAQQWTEQQSQKKEPDCAASLGTRDDRAEDGKRQPPNEYAFHVNDLPYGLKDPPGPGGYGPATLANADQALPGGHSRAYEPPVKKVLIH